MDVKTIFDRLPEFIIFDNKKEYRLVIYKIGGCAIVRYETADKQDFLESKVGTNLQEALEKIHEWWTVFFFTSKGSIYYE